MGTFFSFLDHLNLIEDDSSRYEVSVSEHGFSYLDLVSEKNVRKLSFEEKQKRSTGAALDGSTRARGQSNIKHIETIDHEAFCFDTSLESILRDMEERRQRPEVFPWLAGLGGIFILAWIWWISNLSYPWVGLILSGLIVVPGLTFGLVNAWFWDRSRKDVHFAYKITGKGEAAFHQLNHALSQLQESDQTLLLTGRRHFEDTRYTGGSKNLPDLKPIEFEKARPPVLDLDFEVWHLRAMHRDFYFMPDHVMVFDGAKIGGLSYGTLKLTTSKEVTQGQGLSSAPRDGKVVGTTYRFVNNDGSPDRRFNNNIEIPLIEYGVVDFGGGGMNLTLFVSDQFSARQAPVELASIQDLARKPVRKVAEERRAEAAAHRAAQKEIVYAIILDTLNCMMFADGHAAKEELARIHQLMQRMRAPWQADEIDERIQKFRTRLNATGFENTLNDVCARITTITSPRQKEVIVKGIDHVMKADSKIKNSEKRVRERIVSALSVVKRRD